MFAASESGWTPNARVCHTAATETDFLAEQRSGSQAAIARAGSTSWRGEGLLACSVMGSFVGWLRRRDTR
jgi:hypothetical protein